MRRTALLAAALVLCGCAVPWQAGEREAPPAERPVLSGADLLIVRGVSAHRVWAAGADGIWASADGGRTWTIQYRGEAVHDLTFAGEQHGWALGSRAFLVTADGGRTWEKRPRPRSGLYAVQLLRPDLGVGATARGIAVSRDGGVTWTEHRTPAEPDLFCFADEKHGWVADRDSLYRTTDGGATWEKVAQVLVPPGTVNGAASPHWEQLACPAPDRQWAVMLSGLSGHNRPRFSLARGDGGGRFWHTVHRAAPPKMVVVSRDGVRLAGEGTGSGVAGQVTDDGGRTWQEFTVPGAQVPLDLSFATAEVGWLLARSPVGGEGLLLFRTEDGGRTWQRVNTGE